MVFDKRGATETIPDAMSKFAMVIGSLKINCRGGKAGLNTKFSIKYKKGKTSDLELLWLVKVLLEL